MRYFKFSMIISLLFCTQVQAAPADNLISIFTQLTNLQGKFTQTVYDEHQQVLSVSNGIFVIQRPDRFRWEVTTPMQQLTIADGQEIWLYQPDLKQVTKSRMTSQLGQTPLAILSGSTSAIINNFSITQTSKAQYILMAKNDDNAFHKIVLQFAQQNNHLIPQQMQLSDNLGQRTVLDFAAVKINATLAPTVFHFTVPAGVDVVG